MRVTPPTTEVGKNIAERAQLTFWTLGAARDRGIDGEPGPSPVAMPERLRRLPGALLLTAGYYAGKAPVLGDFLRRPG